MDPFRDDPQIPDLSAAIGLFHESRNAFLKLFNTSPICMSMTSAELENRVYVRVNQKFLETYGFSESEIVGRNSVQIGILDKEESVRVGELIRQKGALHNDYVKSWSKEGKLVHTISSIEKMELAGQTLLVSFFVNITEIVEQRALIEQHAQQLQIVNRELESFSYTVSHDLRNPLNGIEGCIKLLEDHYSGGLDEEGKNLLSMVRQSSKRMRALIADLLDMARLGKSSVEEVDIDMNQLVQEVLAEVKTSTNHKAVITVGNLHVIRADRSLMKQVLMNLISNAIKFSSKKADPQVTITSVVDNDTIALTVSDNGAGFDMAHAGRLFNAFQRLHLRSDFEGTGVGLATVQRIVHHHGGTVSAEATPGKGAKFTVRMPK